MPLRARTLPCLVILLAGLAVPCAGQDSVPQESIDTAVAAARAPTAAVVLGGDTLLVVARRRVHEALLAAAEGTPDILDTPGPFVLQTALGDYAVAYELNAYTSEPNRMAAIYSELHQNIQDRFNEAGIEIMSPAHTAIRDGNRVTIPDGHRPDGYRAPAFRVSRVEGEVRGEREGGEARESE